MGTKAEKVRDINKAIHKSNVAVKKGAKAELLRDGTIQYSVEATTRMGRKYRARSTFRGILSLLHGEDIRELQRKYGR